MASITNCARCGNIMQGGVFDVHCAPCQHVVDLVRWLQHLHHELTAYTAAPSDGGVRRRLEEWLASASRAVTIDNSLAIPLTDQIAAAQALDELERVITQVLPPSATSR